MFNLEQAINEWRRQMTADGIKSSSVLDELENHLREDVERQIRSRIDQEQAFQAAVSRIGQSDLLKAEFAKIGGVKEMRLGKMIGIACGMFTVLFSLWAAPWLLTVHELSRTERMLGLVSVVLTVLSVISWRFSYNYLPVIRNQRARMAAEVLCGIGSVAWLYVFGNLLANVIVPHVLHNEGTSGQIFMIGISLLWALTLASIPGAIAYGLEGAARRQTGKDAYV